MTKSVLALLLSISSLHCAQNLIHFSVDYFITIQFRNVQGFAEKYNSTLIDYCRGVLAMLFPLLNPV